MNSVNREIRCDGCGTVATPEHLRRRVERLELATRFRPIHIDTLILYPAPPERREDYFYRPAPSRDERSPLARAFFDSLFTAAGGDLSGGKNEETLLAEFQRAGNFLVECCECPSSENGAPSANLAARTAPAIMRRVQFSYKPKRILLLSAALAPLVPIFRGAGWKENLLLRDGKPIDIPAVNDSAAYARFRAEVATALSTSPSRANPAKT
ncbi:MAG TPA: hypothetical protein VMV59_10180 [Candidatus Dormibacteraeota bacterium]|nr:hypothetical protein [Candidatus Dormibacteraeota bacterium]